MMRKAQDTLRQPVKTSTVRSGWKLVAGMPPEQDVAEGP